MRSRYTLAFLALLTFAYAYPMQVNGWNQNAHYALVRALADGVPYVDRTRHEIGDLGTGDVSVHDGHVFSNKAPGLAYATLPAFVVVRAVGMRTTGDPTRVIWAQHLWSLVVPAVVLVALVGWATTQLRGAGPAAAVGLGLGTLVLPFATLFFSHVLAACFAFAVFALLLHERRGQPRLALVAAAGALAGLGVMVEYPLALAGAVLGVYPLTRGDVLRRGAAYAAGVAVGILPLLAHNTWAYGSPFHLSYEGNQTEELEGFFGVGLPKPGVLEDLFVSSWGLLPNMPVLACGAVGLVLLWRSGARAEAGALLGVAGVGLLYDSMLEFTAFGGQGLPRYLIYTFPFLAVGIGMCFRRFPLTTLSLGAISVLQMTVMTATNPLAAYDGHWLARLGDRAMSTTGASIVGITGWYSILPFFAAVALALAIALVQMRPFAFRWTELPVAALSVLAWALVAWRATSPVGDGFDRDYVVAAASCILALCVVVSVVAARPPAQRARTETA